MPRRWRYCMNDQDRTILLVEDEALIAMHQSTILEKHGFSVKTALRPEQAMRTVSEEDVDLILMDIDLGSRETDGTVVAEKILARREVPIVFLTSHTEKEYVDRARSITRYGYVLKNSGEFVLTQSIDMAFELFGVHNGLKEENRRRRLAEEVLADKHAELAAIYEHTPVLMVLVDSAYTVRKANAAAAAFAGVGPGDARGERLGEALRCLHRLDDPQGCGFGPYCAQCPIRNTVREALRERSTGTRVEADIPYLADGNRRFASFALTSTFFEIRGEPFVIVSLEDITELKDTLHALTDCSTRYERCYHELPVMLHSIDEGGRILDVNAEWLRTMGYERGEVIGRRSVDFLTEESRRYALEKTLPSFFRIGYARDVPYSFVTKDGKVVEVLLSATADRDIDGNFLRSIAVAVKAADVRAMRRETE